MLRFTDEQTKTITGIYERNEHVVGAFKKDDVSEQSDARDLLEEMGLDKDSREFLERRWSKRWSTRSKGKAKYCRTLYQW